MTNPPPFVFPGCECGKHVKPYTAAVTVVEFIAPPDLQGKQFSFYHDAATLPPSNPWRNTGATYEFHILQDVLGSLYPDDDFRHSYLVPYSHYVQGELMPVATTNETIRNR